MKDGIRVLGIDDSAFEFSDEKAFLTGVVYRGTEFVEDVHCVDVEIDGRNATQMILKLYDKFSNHQQIKAILVDGITVAGFNFVDLDKVFDETGKPVVAVTKNTPNREEFRKTMERTGNYSETFERLPEPVKVDIDEGSCFIQFAGCGKDEAEKFVKKNLINGQVPESIRVADMVGRALNCRR